MTPRIYRSREPDLDIPQLDLLTLLFGKLRDTFAILDRERG
jgi:hypothetical protein